MSDKEIFFTVIMFLVLFAELTTISSKLSDILNELRKRGEK